MRLSKSNITKIKWSNICIAIQCVMLLFVVVITGWNLFNIAGIIPVTAWLIEPTFYGPSLVIVLLLQFGLLSVREQSRFILRVSPYMIGLIIASLLSLCDLPVCLLLMLIIGFWGVIDFQMKYDAKDILFTVLVTCILMEIYSVVLMLAINETTINSKEFMSSGWLEVILLIVVALYCLVNSKEEKNQKGKIQKGAEVIKRNRRLIRKERKEPKQRLLKVRMCLGWVRSHFRQIVILGAEGVCVFSLGLFLFYFVTNSAGVNKILHSGEEVYLLQHCEDTSLVLSLVEDETNHTYNIEFQEYIGANNQKVQVLDCGDGTYQLVFVEPQCALEVQCDSVTGQIKLYAKKPSDNSGQHWEKEVFIPERDMYKFICQYSAPLSYQMLEQASDMPEIIVSENTNGYEFFTLEHSTSDEFVTKMLEKHSEEFTPTLLMETMIGYLGGWSLIVFLLITLVIVTMVKVCNKVRDQFATLYAIIFVYMLAYASVKAIILYMLVLAFLVINKRFNGQEKSKEPVLSRCEKDIDKETKVKIRESLDNIEKSLHEMEDLLLGCPETVSKDKETLELDT